MDETVKQESEEVAIAAKAGLWSPSGKTLPSAYDEAGEGSGFSKWFIVHPRARAVLLQIGSAHVAAGSFWMRNTRRAKKSFEKVPVGCRQIQGASWIEIDFPEDIDDVSDSLEIFAACRDGTLGGECCRPTSHDS